MLTRRQLHRRRNVPRHSRLVPSYFLALLALIALTNASISAGFILHPSCGVAPRSVRRKWRRRRHPLTSPSQFCTTLPATAEDGAAVEGGDDDGDDDDAAARLRRRNDRVASALLFAAVPAASLTLPALLSAGLYAPLFVAKRAAVYGMAGTIVAVAASRAAAEDDPNLGRRLQGLTAEVLPRPTPPSGMPRDDDDARFRELRALDDVDSTAQSAALPAIVAGSLAVSLFLLRLQDGAAGDVSAEDASGMEALVATLRENAREAAPALVGLSNAAVLGLFARAELDRAVRAWGPPTALGSAGPETKEHADADPPSEPSAPPPLATPLAVALVSAAYFLPPNLAWPARNAASMSLGIAVSRAVQLPRLGPIALALAALVLYDVLSVGVMLVELGSATLAASGQVAGEGAATAAAAASASSSAMGAVALSKVGGAAALTGSGSAPSLWQPGLLEVRLKGRATDLLGLGDAVFPSLLATFALRFDRRRKKSEDQLQDLSGQSEQIQSQPPIYFTAAMLGFISGCFACEFVPGIDSSGLPALLFIVPAMFTAVLGLAVVRGEYGEIWSFDPVGDADEVEET